MSAPTPPNPGPTPASPPVAAEQPVAVEAVQKRASLGESLHQIDALGARLDRAGEQISSVDRRLGARLDRAGEQISSVSASASGIGAKVEELARLVDAHQASGAAESKSVRASLRALGTRLAKLEEPEEAEELERGEARQETTDARDAGSPQQRRGTARRRRFSRFSSGGGGGGGGGGGSGGTAGDDDGPLLFSDHVLQPATMRAEGDVVEATGEGGEGEPCMTSEYSGLFYATAALCGINVLQMLAITFISPPPPPFFDMMVTPIEITLQVQQHRSKL